MELHSFLRPSSALQKKPMSFGSDAVLAIVVIAIVALMILPLPTSRGRHVWSPLNITHRRACSC